MADESHLKLVSPDFFKSWSRCRRQFYYKYVQKLNWPSDGRHFTLGKDVHKLLDYAARGLDCAPLIRNAEPAVQRIMAKLDAHPTARLPVLGSEWAFTVPVAQLASETVWLTGRIDRVARAGDGGVMVIDWKTGTGVPKTPETDWQTLTYLYALLEVIRQGRELSVDPHLPAEALRFVYVEIKADETTPVREVSIPYSEARHAETRALLRHEVTQACAEADYALPAQCPDRYCQYRPICGIDSATGASA